jgi:hypothetical protein
MHFFLNYLNYLFSSVNSSYHLGKDTRYVLEHNIGWSVVGQQTSGWLYSHTKKLCELGAIVTYSGDAPFLERLIKGVVTAERVKSKAPLYIDLHDDFYTTKVHEISKKRTDLVVPFSDKCPPHSLVYFKTPMSVCPDAVHMTIRCVEHDLRKMANKVLQAKLPYGEEPLRNFEKNLTERDIKPPYFEFEKERRKDDVVTKVGSVSLSGIEAIAAIADVHEFEGSSTEITPLYSNVWSEEEICLESTSTQGNVIRELGFDHLFTISRDDSDKTLMSMYAAADLLRRSLNECVKLLRSSSTGLHIAEYRHWAEVYYQMSWMLFGEDGLTSYKIKLLLVADLCGPEKPIVTPWNHMTESLEKSNHAAQRFSQLRTMRFGGQKYHEDPTFQDLWYSYCNLLDVSAIHCTQSQLQKCYRIVHDIDENETIVEPKTKFFNTYLKLCQRKLQRPSLAVGTQSELPLLGMHFLPIGAFKAKGDPVDTPTSAILQDWIKCLGGWVLDTQKATRILQSHGKTPHCYVIIKSDEELRRGTTYESERGAINSGKKTAGKKQVLSRYAIACRKYAEGDFIFLKWNYIQDVRNSKRVLNIDSYKLQPGPRVRKLKIKEFMPLFIRQCDPRKGNIVTARTALKRYRRLALRTLYERAR